eukprot:TRINITY_DN177_c0_g1_i9.p1 TRINITY_DN177_c0_g1~~TRINITY_DN177_c0_g1_i9.p1  ORF type:complete len:840 (-),score=260.27 TRINITY_DN177_c0_g1_i9:54-2573(-)
MSLEDKTDKKKNRSRKKSKRITKDKDKKKHHHKETIETSVPPPGDSVPPPSYIPAGPQFGVPPPGDSVPPPPSYVPEGPGGIPPPPSYNPGIPPPPDYLPAPPPPDASNNYELPLPPNYVPPGLADIPPPPSYVPPGPSDVPPPTPSYVPSGPADILPPPSYVSEPADIPPPPSYLPSGQGETASQANPLKKSYNAVPPPPIFAQGNSIPPPPSYVPDDIPPPPPSYVPDGPGDSIPPPPSYVPDDIPPPPPSYVPDGPGDSIPPLPSYTQTGNGNDLPPPPPPPSYVPSGPADIPPPPPPSYVPDDIPPPPPSYVPDDIPPPPPSVDFVPQNTEDVNLNIPQDDVQQVAEISSETEILTEEDEKEKKMWLQRYRIMQEIITTEFVYVRDLRTIITLFVDELNENKSILPQNEINNIFANIETIYGINKELYAELKRNSLLYDSPDKAQAGKGQLGTVFLQLADYLKMYTLYINNHNNSLDRHSACRKKYSSYDKFVIQAQQSPECQGLQLTDFLVKPIQRLCKYPLLFRELLATTPETHPDYNHVQQTLFKVNAIAQHIDQMTRSRENLEILTEFDQRVSGFPGKMIEFLSSRNYIRDDILDNVDYFNDRQTTHFYLFSDILVLTKPGKKKEIWEVTLHIKDIINAEDYPQDPEGKSFTVNTSYQGLDQFTLAANGAGAKNLWISDINNAVEKWQNLVDKNFISTPSQMNGEKKALKTIKKRRGSLIRKKSAMKKGLSVLNAAGIGSEDVSISAQSLGEEVTTTSEQSDELKSLDTKVNIMVSGQDVIIKKLEKENQELKEKLRSLIEGTEFETLLSSVEDLDKVFSTIVNTLEKAQN